ncbi:hypothetical protein BDZ90DRAFT_96756 [Jaminaea rosea]|uniref:F-box domain-containing protein n=1 Tax=Jaminaea rosea TaxID=1569628 RepID=A0A316UHK0_9BASI|nr:hypothetical protein BDZ90DRAFT_96756 [Jaminaea rosea]PWN24807.1 hypothetical protein BDZ90DRAFT_96756 [Jaminaea rosea]
MARGPIPSSSTTAQEERERVLTRRLAASQEKLWEQSQTLLERSRLRSMRGDRVGALQDAKRALALFPANIEYLIRAAETLLDSGFPDKASRAFEQAEGAANIEGTTSEICAALSTLANRLRPFDMLPNEILATIFEHVYADWQRLPSPFQLPHVCRRWRSIAKITQSLWRDLRILRVPTKLSTFTPNLSVELRRPPCFSSSSTHPVAQFCHARAGNHLRLIKHCAELSNNTLTHFEFHTLSGDLDMAAALLHVAQGSAATLVALSIINNDKDDDPIPGSLSLALRCPRLTYLELSPKSIHGRELKQLEDEVKHLDPLPASLRTLKYNDLSDLSIRRARRTRELFLHRCSQLEQLTLLDIYTASDRALFDEAELGTEHTFPRDLLVRCAQSLVELETSAFKSLFTRAKAEGLSALPRLRRLRHVPFADFVDEDVPDFHELALPNLKVIEAPINVVESMHRVPARVVLHLRFNEETDLLSQIKSWLLSLDDDNTPEEITLELLERNVGTEDFNELIDVLIPSRAGRIICPQLTAFSVLTRDEIYSEGDEASPFDIYSKPIPQPKFREDWQHSVIDASRLARMEAERRRVSKGLPAINNSASGKAPDPVPSAFSRGAPAAKRVKVSAPPDKAWGPCEALRSIKIESCYVQPDAWAVMKASPCRFEVTPDPEVAAMLPWQEPSAAKRNRFGERKVHAW